MTKLPIAIFCGFALMFLAWLVPNHYWPWTSFHSDALAALSLVVLAVAARPWHQRHSVVPRISLICTAVACIPLLQAATGLIYYWGDAWVSFLYLAGFSLSIVVGATVLLRYNASDVLLVLWVCLVSAAIISTAAQISQWLGLSNLGVFVVELPSNTRPFGNLAQPNQLATVLMLGVVGACALRQSDSISRFAFVLTTGFLCFGVVMSGSRAAWLEMGLLIVAIIALRDRASLRVSRTEALALVLAFVALVLIWTPLCDALYLPVGRSLQEQASGGTRPLHWLTILDAIIRRPWTGYGWAQVAVAQASVAAAHPFVGEMIEHSHNIVLDAMVWNGIPFGLLMIAAFGWWFWRHLGVCRDPRIILLLLGISIVLVHSLLEFPLEYAYLLLPIGVMIGAVEALSAQRHLVSVRRSTILLLMSLAVGLTAWVAVEYVQIEEDGRQLRFEAAKIGEPGTTTPPPNVILLTQLREFYRLARTPARPGMTELELEAMRRVAQRYPFPPVLFRYANALALNGRPDDAVATLTLLCKTSQRERCLEGRDAWLTMAQGQYPELKGVQWPELPPPRQEARAR